jgi:hypothetical protein
MFRKGLLPLILLTLLVVGLAGASSSAAFRAGWSQGYDAAQEVEGDDGRAAESVPDRSGRYDGRRFGPAFGFFPFFWGVGLLFKLFLFLLLFGFIARLFFRPWRWGGWRHGRHPHEKPPWAYGGGDPDDDKVYKV